MTELMLATTTPAADRAALLADLTDLLQLEFDERHARELTAAIRELGGIPLALPHLPTGLLKLGVQLAGVPGGDRTVLLAFVSNGWQSREKYARYAAKSHPAGRESLLRRNAEDEARHYAWALDALEDLGCGERTVVGQAARAFAQVHGATAETLEQIGRAALESGLRTFGTAA